MLDHLPHDLELKGHYVALEPLKRNHLDGLAEAARDGELWNLTVTSVPHPDALDSWFKNAVGERAQNRQLPFVVRRNSDQQIVGSTRYYDIEPLHGNLSIGYTWYAKSARRTAVNTECKLLLLTHAFEICECAVVYWHTHHQNYASQAAITRLGAKLDGIIRAHKRMPDGGLRDTYSYSMTAAEWPDVKASLQKRLA